MNRPSENMALVASLEAVRGIIIFGTLAAFVGIVISAAGGAL